MSSIQFAVLILLPALALGAPSYGEGYCRTEYETVYSKVCNTKYDKRCHMSSKTKYDTKYDQKCETVYEKNCYPVPRQVPDKECRTEYDQVCTKNTQKTYTTQYDERCQDIVKNVRCLKIIYLKLIFKREFS